MMNSSYTIKSGSAELVSCRSRVVVAVLRAPLHLGVDSIAAVVAAAVRDLGCVAAGTLAASDPFPRGVAALRR